MSRPRRFRHGPRRSISEAVEDAVASEDRSRFHMSISEMAEFLGRDRGTISAWIAKGCPTVRAGGTGEATILDPKDIVAWRETFVREEEASKYASPDAGLEDDPSLRMKPSDLLKMEQLRQSRIKTALLKAPRCRSDRAGRR